MPLLSIEFSAHDLSRVRPADPDPMWDTVLSLHVLQHDAGLPPRLRRWQHQLRGGIANVTPLHELFAVSPYASYFPDFLTPGGAGDQPAAQLDRVAATPPEQVVTETEQTPVTSGAGSRLRSELLADPQAGLARLVQLLRSYSRLVRGAGSQEQDADLAFHRRTRLELLAAGGVEALLMSFGADVAVWDPPVLKVPYCVDQTLRLDGRGLTLVPSWFCTGRAITLADPALPPVLVYPIEGCRSTSGTPTPARRSRSLAALLGRTRALVLLSSNGRSTGELATALGLPASTVSEHLGVLRDAGLVATTRTGNRTHHLRTATGDALI